MAEVVLLAPVAGWLAPLDEVDDPVFAGRMLGDGVAIDPVDGEFRAPCDGVIVSAHPAGHAVTLRAANGAEILLHVGLETVELAGEGFTRHVTEGQTVTAGAPLISVDLDQAALRAKSLISPMVVANGEAFALSDRRTGRRVAAGEPVMRISGGTAVEPRAVAPAVARRVRVGATHGLHARPAALVAAEAKRHHVEITLTAGGRSASARSPVALMALGLAGGAEAILEASGPDAAAALAAVAELIERHGPAAEPAQAPASFPAPKSLAESPGLLRGAPAAPGIAIGQAVRLIAPPPAVIETSRGVEAESVALAAALKAVRARLSHQSARGPREQREIASAHLAFLDDENLLGAADAAIAAGASAGVAWKRAIEAQAKTLAGLADRHIAQRADDLLDLERQILVELAGESDIRQRLPEHAVLVADDLLPGQLLALEGAPVGIAAAGGGPTSHVAILAQAMNIPAVVAVGPALTGVADGATVILDGGAGSVRVAPSAAELAAAQAELARRQASEAVARSAAAQSCRTADGVRIEVMANLGAVAEAAAALTNGAEGCGLLRTEFLFMGRATPPDEAEQFEAYQAIANALDGQPLTIRTLDIGGDKPVAFLDQPAEDNPALGVRGVRVSLRRPDLLEIQLRAILRVKPAGQCRVLVPMVAGVGEFEAVRETAARLVADLGRSQPISVGAMIETPAAALVAEALAARADFFSVGTNDLSQYVLAMDRGNPALAAEIDALDPAVLAAIAAAVAGARAHSRPVSVCGGLAADPAASAVLIGLGVRGLSAPSTVVPAVKAAVRALDLISCEALARRALACANAGQVRALLAAWPPGAGAA